MRKYAELLMIPIAIIIMVMYNHVAIKSGLHVMTWEKIEKVIAGLVIFLLISGFIRLFYLVVFPTLYRYFDPSFKENKKWQNLEPADRTKYSILFYCCLLITFALIVNGL